MYERERERGREGARRREREKERKNTSAFYFLCVRERVPFSFQYRELKGPFRLGGGGYQLVSLCLNYLVLVHLCDYIYRVTCQRILLISFWVCI